MDEVQQDKSVNLLKTWHKKKNIRCPTCKASLFHFDGTPYFSLARIKYEIVLIHHSPCPLPIGNIGRGLFFCLSCGGQSSHTLGRLQDRGCKCVEVNCIEEKSSPSQKQCNKRVNNANETAEQNKTTDDCVTRIQDHCVRFDDASNYDRDRCDNNNPKKNGEHRMTTYQSAASIRDDVDHFDNVNIFCCDSQVNDGMDPDVDGTAIGPDGERSGLGPDVKAIENRTLNKKMNLGIKAEYSCPVYISPTDILRNRNEWPTASSRFFIRDHKNQGDGLRGLVFNSVIDSKINCDFSSLTVNEMFFHLHIASIHYGLPTTKSVDVTAMMLQLSTDHNQTIQKERDSMKDAYQKSIVKVLMAHGIVNNQDHIRKILDEINHCVQTEMQSNYVKSHFNNSSAPVKHNAVRAVYTDGHNSIVNNLPIPTVSIIHKAAYIPAKEIVNHLLAIGIDVMFFRAGHKDDWVDKSGNYETEFLRDLHQNVSTMTDIPTYTRIILVKVWSDGFEAHQIKGKNEFNSLQIFTLTVIAPHYQNTNRHTVPFALCFKRKSHHDILIQLLGELRELQSPTLRYWGGEENLVYPTMVFLEMVSNDLPERCSNTCITLNGTFTHRWRHSCLFDDNVVPSCQSCYLQNIEYILSLPSVNIKTESSCDRCLDWWIRGVTKPKIYPIQPESFQRQIKKFPPVELSFEMMHNSILCLQDWCCSSNSSKTEKGKVIKAYLKAIGFSTQLIPALCQDILEGKEVTDSPGFPSILRNYTSVNVEMNSFQTMPMHMCFLGIEKSLIGLTSILANRKDHGQNAAWHKLVNAIQESQETINSVYLVWCLAMKFTDMEKKNIGTANWQSDHYLAFTRVSLFHFSPLDWAEITNKLDKQLVLAFRSMRVTWFCFVSHIFAEEKVPLKTINVLVRLFLSSCRRFWILGNRNGLHESTDEVSTSQKGLSGQKRKVDDDKLANTSKKVTKPFYVSKANFLSLLNIGEMIEQSGSLRHCWEGENESYIQNVKREISTMKHNENYLKTILIKILKTEILDYFNKDNPFSKAKKYSRTSHVRIYNKGLKHSTVEDVFAQEDIVSGVIDKNGYPLVCFEESRVRGIGLYPLVFNDNNGMWKLNLWYSETRPEINHFSVYKSREELLKDCADFFILLREKDTINTSVRTLICRSWRVRDDRGNFRLPLPLKNVLLMK